MDYLNASDVKNTFGEVLIKAQQGPVGINKNGKPVAVMVSAAEYEEIERLRASFLNLELQKGIDALNAGEVTDGADVMAALRQRVSDAAL